MTPELRAKIWAWQLDTRAWQLDTRDLAEALLAEDHVIEAKILDRLADDADDWTAPLDRIGQDAERALGMVMLGI